MTNDEGRPSLSAVPDFVLRPLSFVLRLSVGIIMQVAEQIYQIQLPLPFALRSVNCYLLRDDDGWTIIDSGLNYPAGQAAWQQAFDSMDISPSSIRRIVLTHYHPDHFGLAGWLQQQSGAEVFLAPREIESVRLYWQMAEDELDPIVPMFAEHGVPPDLAAAIAYEVSRMRSMTAPHPTITPLLPGTTLHMGGRSWQAIHTPGHSDGQLIFYAASDNLALVGDHVLVKISPHVGLWPDSEPDPLGRYLASLAELRSLQVDLALPGHGPLIREWRSRLEQLIAHHAERLTIMREAVGTAANAYEVTTRVFAFDRYTAHEKRFAVAETLAHLELLVVRGELRKEYREGGWVYLEMVR
jgi:glyoxylase-like metal-dependent hydrolase (beta-lactamase superfamily II)